VKHHPRYPSYTETNNGWLNPIPTGWSSLRLRYACSYKNSNVDKKSYPGQPAVQLCNYTDVYYNEFVRRDMDFMYATASPAEIEKFELKAGDIIITKDSEDPRDIGIPTLVSENLPGVICGYHLTVIRTNSLPKARFLHRLLQSQLTKAHFFVESPGVTRFGLNQEAIGGTPVALPSETEMQAISDALDRETARIDALIEKKTRFIELLKEKRQALITQAVTKGLDPTVPMKDSGVEWIGEVPAGWKVLPLKRFANRVVVGIAEAATHAYADEGIPILRSTNIRAGRMVGDLLYLRPDFATDRASKLIKAGDLVTVRTGNAGVTTVVPDHLDGCQCFTMLITTLANPKLNRFFEYFINCPVAQSYFAVRGWGTAQINISVPILKELPICVPPDEELMQIVAELDRRVRHIDELIRKTQISIDLLKERRSALITAAVTGQIDLREDAA
jgi:type I restriction enzyme S subunit